MTRILRRRELVFKRVDEWGGRVIGMDLLEGMEG